MPEFVNLRNSCETGRKTKVTQIENIRINVIYANHAIQFKKQEFPQGT